MLKKLTIDQRQKMFNVRDEWLNKFFKHNNFFDEDEARKGVEWLYDFCGFKKPKVIIMSSPLGCQLIANILNDKGVLQEVGQKVGQKLGQEVGQKVGQKLGQEVRQKVGQEVGQEVRKEVGQKVGRKFYEFAWYGNIWDYGWCAFYDFFMRIGAIGKNKDFIEFVKLLDSGIYDMIQFENVCIVSKKPIKILRQGVKLHSEKEPAIQFRDGYSQYYLHGISFDKELWSKIVGGKLTFKQIMAIKNIEQRMTALKMYDSEKLLIDANAKCVHMGVNKARRKDGKIIDYTNYLYLIKDIFDEDAYFLQYACPSTGRIYVDGVDPEFAKKSMNADECMAWKGGVDIEDYRNLIVET
jgi:hypothetical protein